MYISTNDVNRFLDTRKHLQAFRKPNCMAKYAKVMTASPVAAFNVSAILYDGKHDKNKAFNIIVILYRWTTHV